ncbi:MAG TPA: M48 family metallopeptidase [Pyrinomonadaceae bacterium]|nr:M48 family metallopeptidase [Pyrinomonadaceae bacterium]
MKFHLSRAGIAFGLGASLWLGSVSSFAAPQQSKDQGQAKDQTAQQSSQSTTQQQSNTSATDKAKPSSSPQTTASTKRPLSTGEDPEQIGKRNINKGIWAHGILGAKGTESEVKMGRMLAAQVDKEAKFVDDPIITEYVNRVGQNVVLHSDAKVPFTIKVIDSDEVNAFALPGGFFYVNKGLILAADNEAELAGVMAHEIAHVAARHAMENEAKMRAIDYGMLAGMILGGPIVSNVLYNGGQFFEGMAFLKFSRGAEEEADKLGVQYMWAAGYDPGAMATMFEKLEAKNKKKPGSVAKLFQDHPAPADRRQSALALAARFPEREEYVISSSEFQRVKNRLLRLSNARATTGAIASSDDGTPGRPTLKRRQPTPDDPTTTTTPTNSDGTPKTDPNKPAPPTLRRTPEPQASPTPQPQQ